MDDRKGELEQKYLDYYFPKILITISQVWSRNTMTLTWFCHCYAPNAWTSIFQLKWISGEFFSSCYLVVPTYQHFSTVINIAELGSIVVIPLPGSIARILCVRSSQGIKSSKLHWQNGFKQRRFDGRTTHNISIAVQHSAHREPKNTRVKSTGF